MDYTELRSVEATVRRALRECAYLRGPAGSQRLQFLELPTFGDWIAWDIADDPSNDSSVAIHRTTWRRRRDVGILTSPLERMKYPRDYAPAIETRAATVARVEIEQILARFADCRLPMLTDSTTIGLDGDSYELALAATAHQSTIRVFWRNEPPAAWAAILPAIAGLRRILPGAFEE